MPIETVGPDRRVVSRIWRYVPDRYGSVGQPLRRGGVPLGMQLRVVSRMSSASVLLSYPQELHNSSIGHPHFSWSSTRVTQPQASPRHNHVLQSRPSQPQCPTPTKTAYAHTSRPCPPPRTPTDGTPSGPPVPSSPGTAAAQTPRSSTFSRRRLRRLYPPAQTQRLARPPSGRLIR
jgi:hypothetical protein